MSGPGWVAAGRRGQAGAPAAATAVAACLLRRPLVSLCLGPLLSEASGIDTSLYRIFLHLVLGGKARVVPISFSVTSPASVNQAISACTGVASDSPPRWLVPPVRVLQQHQQAADRRSRSWHYPGLRLAGSALVPSLGRT